MPLTLGLKDQFLVGPIIVIKKKDWMCKVWYRVTMAYLRAYQPFDMIIPGWNPGNAQNYERNVQEFHTWSINYYLFSKFMWIFWNFKMNILASLMILKVEKKILYQKGRDDISYLTHTKKSIRNDTELIRQQKWTK